MKLYQVNTTIQIEVQATSEADARQKADALMAEAETAMRNAMPAQPAVDDFRFIEGGDVYVSNDATEEWEKP